MVVLDISEKKTGFPGGVLPQIKLSTVTLTTS